MVLNSNDNSWKIFIDVHNENSICSYIAKDFRIHDRHTYVLSYSPFDVIFSSSSFLSVAAALLSTTLIILCSIENHHKKINSFYHTLLTSSLFSHNDRLFFSFSWSVLFYYFSLCVLIHISFLVLNFPFIS